MDREEVAVLLAIYLVQKSPRASQSRQIAVRHLIEIAIFESGGAIPEVELDRRVAEVAGLDTPPPAGLLQPALEEELNLGFVARRDGRLSLTEERSGLITAAQEQYHRDEKHFAEHVVACVASEFGGNLSELAEPMISQAVATVVVESARRCLPDAPGRIALQSDGQAEGARLFDALGYLTGQLRVVSDNFEPGRLDLLVTGIRKYFGDLDDPCKRYFMGLYHKVFCHQLLNLDPHLHETQRHALAQTRVYLDTNVAVDYLLGHDKVSPASIDVIESCRALGIQVFISPMTMNELVHLRESSDRFRTLVEDERVQRVLGAKPGTQTNPFVLAYFKKRSSNPRLTWSGFIKPFKDPEQLLLTKEVLVEAEGSAGLRDHEHYGRVWSTLRAIKAEGQPDRIVDHDAENFLLVHESRRRYPPNMLFGPAVWLMTRDRTLEILDRRLGSIYPHPHSRHVAQWGERLLPFQCVGRFVATDYIAYALQARLGILPPTEGIDIEFLSLLSQAEEFDLDQVLDLEPEHAAQVLLDLQMDREVLQLAGRAASAPEEVERENAGRKLAERTLWVVASEREKAAKAAIEAEERLASAEAALEAIQEENRQMRIVVQGLRNEMEKLESASFWQRLRWLLRRPRRE